MNRAAENILTAIVAVSLFLGLALEANADASKDRAGSEPVSITVSHADLDLGSPAGMKALERRVESAARKVCGSQQVREVGLAQAIANRRCAEAAVDSAQDRTREGRVAGL